MMGIIMSPLRLQANRVAGVCKQVKKEVCMSAQNKNQVTILVFLILLALSVSPIFGGKQEGSQDAVDFSLEDLLNQEISTVSKQSENISDAPGVVTTVTAREIEYFGANNLLEVLERVPGAYGMWSHYFPQNGFSMRGDYPTHVNAHILLLINGRPLRESVLGGFNSAIYTTFPISAIERIEIIRGPGSVLYGTNAFAGVVNIITKKTETGHMNLSVGGGSLGTMKGGVSAGIKRKSFDITADASYFKESGWEFGAFLAPGKWVSGDYSEELYSANVNVNYGNLSLNAFLGRNKQGIIVPPQYAQQGDYTGKRLFLDIGYQLSFSKKWTADFNLTYNRMEDVFTNTQGKITGPKSDDILVEMTHYIKPNERFNLLVGGSVNFQSGYFKTISGGTITFPIESYDQTWWNFYVQADYRPSKYLKLIAGGQLNKPNNVDADFVPRVGVVVNATPKWGFKLLYGQAFRSAFSGETRFVNPPVLLGDASLTPEKVETIDAQVFFNGKSTQLSATYFHSKEKNLITRKPSPVPGYRLIYTNAGTLTLQGIELEMKSSPGKNLFLMGSVVYMTNKNDKGLKDATFVPNFLAKAGIAYSYKNLYSVSLFNTFSGKPNRVTVINPNASILNPEINSFNNLTANLRINLARLFKFSTSKAIMLSIYGVNLLDEEPYQPEIIFKRINSVPSRAGRAFYATLSVEL